MSLTPGDRLEGIARIAHALELKVTHTHEELVFIEHNNFLFWCDPNDTTAAVVYFNQECEPAERSLFEKRISNASRAAEGLEVYLGGTYALTEVEGEEELQLELFDEGDEEED